MDKQLFLRAIQQIEAGTTVLKELFKQEYSQAAEPPKPGSKKPRKFKLAVAESLPEQELGPTPNWESEDWPEAIPLHLVVSEDAPDAEKRFRAIQILSMLDRDLSGLRCLDLGCGSGHIAVEMAGKTHPVVAYDIKANPAWKNFKDTTVQFTTSKEDWIEKEFDFILCYDVIDHLLGEDPIGFLTWVKSLLAPQGVLILRAHPWTSRHGSHSYEIVNKAYIHLALTPGELQANGITVDSSLRLVRPLASYEAMAKHAGLKIAHKQAIVMDLEDFFGDELLDRINKINWRGNITPEVVKKIMSTQFLDYTFQRE